MNEKNRPNEDEEAIANLIRSNNESAGNSFALTLLVIQIAKQVPDLQKLIKDFSNASEVMISNSMHSTLTDPVLAAFESSAERLRLEIEKMKNLGS